MIKAEFYICADKLGFDEISSLVNGEGKVTRSEEIKIPEFRKDYWSIETEYVDTEDVSIILDMISEKISAEISTLKYLINRNKAECGFNIVIKADDGIYVPVHLKKSFVKLAAELNASIGIDLI